MNPNGHQCITDAVLGPDQNIDGRQSSPAEPIAVLPIDGALPLSDSPAALPLRRRSTTRGQYRLAVLSAVVTLVAIGQSAAFAQEQPVRPAGASPSSSSGPESAPQAPAKVPVEGSVDSSVASPIKTDGPTLRPVQESDPETLPLAPVKPRSPEAQNRVEAAARFAAGRLLEARNELKQAMEQYRQAIALDPTAVEVYRALVPLAMQLDQLDEAIRLAKKAVELDPHDVELLFRIGLQSARMRDFDAAIKSLEQARGSKALVVESPLNVLLQIELGVLYQVTKQPAKAADCYAVVFDAIKQPDKYGLDFRARSGMLADPRTSYERIGQVLMDGGRLELAAEAVELAAKTNRSAAGNLTYNRAKILLLSNKADAALEELQKYFDAQRQSKGRDAYQLLSEILTKLNRQQELIGRLQSLAEKDPRNAQLQYFFADALVAAGDLPRAKETYEAVLKGGGDAAGYLGMAGVLRRMKRSDELLDALGRALAKIGPEGLDELDTELKAVTADAVLVDALVTAGRAQAQADPPQLSFEEGYLLAKIVAELKRVDTAVEFYRLAIAREKDRAPLAYRELGELLMQEERYKEAAGAYEEAIKLRLPPELKARFFLGLIQARELAGETPQALEAVADARRQFPQVPLFEFQEAWVYFHSRQLDEAQKRFERMLTAYPDQQDIVRRCQFSLSALFVMKGELRKGEEILEKVLEEDPDDPSVNNDLGYLYADQGKHLEKAETMIRKAVAAEPENAAYLDSLGWILFKRGRIEEAVEPLEKATKLRSSGDGTIWDHLGDVYQRLNRLPDAIRAWETAVKQTEADKHPDEKLLERIRTKLKEHRPEPKPAAQP